LSYGPFTSLKDAVGGACGKRILYVAYLGAGPVYRFRNFFGGLAGHIFSKGFAKEFGYAIDRSAALAAPSFKGIVRNGNRRLHT
jgi:hypothetical protein